MTSIYETFIATQFKVLLQNFKHSHLTDKINCIIETLPILIIALWLWETNSWVMNQEKVNSIKKELSASKQKIKKSQNSS